MPTLLANPYNIGQLQQVVKIGLVNWHVGATMEMSKIAPVRSLFWEKNADEYSEEHSNFSESGFSSVTGDGEDYKLVSDTEGDTITLTQVKRTVRRKITEDLIEFNKYPRIAMLLQRTGSKLLRGYALDLTHKFTFAFDTTMTDRDGRAVTLTGGAGSALCANTQTLNNGDTFDNLITARFSESAYEDAVDLGNAMIDHNGQLIMPEFGVIVSGNHSATSASIQRFVRQGRQPDTDLNNDNIYQGKLRHVVLNWLDTTASGTKDTTKSRFWFLIDETMAKNGNLISSVRTMPNPEAPTVDPDNNTVQFKGKMRYDIGHLDANWIIGSNAV